jgi:hypothetical protein
MVRQVSTGGRIGFPTATAISVLQYDSRGNVVSQLDELDANTDGTIDTRASVANTYNSRGQLVKTVNKSDSDGDGTFDYILTVTVLYDGVKR